MSKAYLGTMQVAYPVESINRKLALRSEKCVEKTLSSGDNYHEVIIPAKKYIGGFTRTKSIVTGNGKVEIVTAQYCFVRKNKFVKSMSADAIQGRLVFGEVSRSIGPLMRNLSELTNMQTKWVEGKADVSKTLNGISTRGYDYTGWVFAVQHAGRIGNDQYDLTKFPRVWDGE